MPVKQPVNDGGFVVKRTIGNLRGLFRLGLLDSHLRSIVRINLNVSNRSRAKSLVNKMESAICHSWLHLFVVWRHHCVRSAPVYMNFKAFFNTSFMSYILVSNLHLIY
jgi:hypothetical protein